MLIARAVAPKLQEKLGGSFVVDKKPRRAGGTTRAAAAGPSAAAGTDPATTFLGVVARARS
jgi:hypothetical protein